MQLAKSEINSLYYFGIAITFLSALMVMSTQSSADHNNSHEYGQRHLLIELTPATCALYPVRANSAQCLNHHHITVEGLDLGYRCTSSSTPEISPVQRRVLKRVMPDKPFVDQSWRRYGACSPYHSSAYFRQLNDLAKELKVPNRLKERHSFVISKSLFIEDMKRSNPEISADSIQLTCQSGNLSQPILTKMKICYSGTSFSRCPTIPDSCGDNFVIWGSYE